MRHLFHKFSTVVSNAVGSPYSFILALCIIVIWAVSGPGAGFSDTWQLIINTGTTIVTFLMVFLIQNTQNRDSKALHIKLDELIRSTQHARNKIIDVESLDDAELEQLYKEFGELHAKTSAALEKRRAQKHSTTTTENSSR